MNLRAIAAIVEKDLRVVAKSKGVLIPLIIVPLIVTVCMPALLGVLPRVLASETMAPRGDFGSVFRQLPPEFQAGLAGYNELQMFTTITLVYYLAPMYLILPLMVASVIAADGLAGEKERKTLEALLYTPTSDGELFVAKLLSAWLPAIGVAWGGFVVYSLTANWAAYPVLGQALFPNALWLWLALWVAPAVAGLGLGFTVLISARVNTFQEAYQLGSLVVLPVVALIISQVTGGLLLDVRLVVLIGGLLWLVDGALLWFGARSIHRSSLAAKI